MILFFDSSAMIKAYIEEEGSSEVDKLINLANEIIVSPITKIECFSAIKRLLIENQSSEKEYKEIKNDIIFDFSFFNILYFNQYIEATAIELVDKYQLKTLDSIQLASCIEVKNKITSFIVCDNKLLNAANKENLPIINPIDIR